MFLITGGSWRTRGHQMGRLDKNCTSAIYSDVDSIITAAWYDHNASALCLALLHEHALDLFAVIITCTPSCMLWAPRIHTGSRVQNEPPPPPPAAHRVRIGPPMLTWRLFPRVSQSREQTELLVCWKAIGIQTNHLSLCLQQFPKDQPRLPQES